MNFVLSYTLYVVTHSHVLDTVQILTCQEHNPLLLSFLSTSPNRIFPWEKQFSAISTFCSWNSTNIQEKLQRHFYFLQIQWIYRKRFSFWVKWYSSNPFINKKKCSRSMNFNWTASQYFCLNLKLLSNLHFVAMVTIAIVTYNIGWMVIVIERIQLFSKLNKFTYFRMTQVHFQHELISNY